MKKIYFSRLFIFLCVIFTSVAYAQTSSSQFQELIIQVPGIQHSRGFPEIKNQLKAIDGVQVVAFCQSQQLILLRVDGSKVTGNKIIYDAISNLHFDFYVKVDAAIEQALTTCKPYERPADDELQTK